jgi:magnesium transporter
MTRLFEVTRAGLVEQHRTTRAGFHLPRESVSWFVIRRDGTTWDIRGEGLPFDDAMLAWIATPEQRPTFRMKGKFGLVDLALYNAASNERPEYVRMVIGRNLLITIGSAESAVLESIPEEVREITSPVKPVVEDILYNVVNAMIAAHAEDAANVRQFVNDLALRVDSDISSVEVREILGAKTRLDRLSYVLEEQSITLGFSPHIRWRGRSDRVRIEFANLRTSLRSLEASMANTRSRLDTIHHQYLLVLQEASNKRLNVLTIVQAIFVPLTFLAGIFGMNFSYMPGLEWRFGYFAALGVMVLITAFSLRYFARHGWFE